MPAVAEVFGVEGTIWNAFSPPTGGVLSLGGSGGSPEYEVYEGNSLLVPVSRTDGSVGIISVSYECIDGTASSLWIVGAYENISPGVYPEYTYEPMSDTLVEVTPGVPSDEYIDAYVVVDRLGEIVTVYAYQVSSETPDVPVGFFYIDNNGDYISVSGVLTWADGDVADKYIDIYAFYDDVQEPGGETLTVLLSDPIGTSISGSATAGVIILDNPVGLTLSNGPTQGVITLSASSDSPGEFVVAFNYTNIAMLGTPNISASYGGIIAPSSTATSGTITYPTGFTAGNIATLNWFNPGSYTLSVSAADGSADSIDIPT